MRVAALYDVRGNVRALDAVRAGIPAATPSSSRKAAVAFFENRAVGA